MLGRVVAEDVYAPGNDEDPIVTRNTLLDERLVARLEDSGVQSVKVRSTITCESSFGVCALCYGRDWPVAIWSTRARRWGHRRAVDR